MAESDKEYSARGAGTGEPRDGEDRRRSGAGGNPDSRGPVYAGTRLRAALASRLTAVGAMFFLNGMLLGVWVPHIPEVQQRLGIGEGALGMALLMLPLGSLSMMPVGAWIIRSFGSRRATLLGFLAFALGLSAVLVAPVYILVAGGLLLFGVGNGLMDVGMNAQGVAVEHTRPRPVMSSLHGLYSVGNFGGAMLAGGLLSLGIVPHVNGVVAAAGALVVGMPFGLRLAGKTVNDGGTVLAAGAEPGTGTEPGAGTEPTPGADAAGTRAAAGTDGGPGTGQPPGADGAADATPGLVVRHVAAFVALLSVLAFLNLLGESAMNDWSTVYMRSVLGSPAATAAVAYGAFAFAMAIGRLSGDWVIAVTGRRFVLGAGFALAAAGIILSMLSSTAPAAIVGFGLVGLGLANGIPILFGAAGRVKGLREGSGMAVVMGVAYAGGLVSPPTIGFVAETVGLQVTLLWLGVVLLVAAGISIFISVK